ncbi:hypothetical protein F7734_10465 [Scytonema sp. UIC 10036]|uniref:hypothetical protein n=1 Tax=Scytonema sp. UIC 10036 TaxID=2304196 RepID=UPI0012DA949A|nr:hypothetical protein [Scytonema sp. UIC 10036]MUG92849.1 hypothetical protein [Scytonema sp. UIC 10036]
MDEFVTDKIADIRVGDSVLLKWDGYRGVPKYLSGCWAEVTELKKNPIIVQPATIVGTITIKFQQISKVRKSG